MYMMNALKEPLRKSYLPPRPQEASVLSDFLRYTHPALSHTAIGISEIYGTRCSIEFPQRTLSSQGS